MIDEVNAHPGISYLADANVHRWKHGNCKTLCDLLAPYDLLGVPTLQECQRLPPGYAFASLLQVFFYVKPGAGILPKFGYIRQIIRCVQQSREVCSLRKFFMAFADWRPASASSIDTESTVGAIKESARVQFLR
jgi:hypothetical protein